MTRAEMLARVRRALDGVEPPALAPVSAPASSTPGGVSLDRPPSATDLLRRFTAEARAVGTLVHVAADLAAAAAIVAGVVRRTTAAAGVVAWRTALVTELLDRARVTVPDLAVRFADEDGAALAHAEVGVTEADALIAASGTLLLGAAGARHRATSLLPRVHVALAPVDRLVADLGTALRALPAAVAGPCTTLITGPSRTADIEKKLVVGVHGPCELHVVVVGVEAGTAEPRA